MASLIFSIIFMYSLICILIYIFQDKLIFFPQAPVEASYESVSKNEIEFFDDGEKTVGWKINNSQGADKTILYFGGNAEDVIYFNKEASEFNVKQSVAFNHPGYGKSSGKPSQKSLYKNALSSYDWVIKEYNLKPGDIIVVGRSLGSSVASYLAAKRKIAGLILITPFDSIENIAKDKYKFLPIHLLIKHPFPTIDYIKQVTVPVLMLAAEKDEIISKNNLDNLIKQTKNNSQLIVYKNQGHNTLQNHADYYADINRFIESLKMDVITQTKIKDTLQQ